jgi:hypothetical protein
MNDEQLKQLIELFKSFGFEPSRVEQRLTGVDNFNSGELVLGFNVRITYPTGKQEE